MLFKMQAIEDKKIQKMYDKSMKELGKFFDINWKKNKPRLYIVKNRESATNWWNRGTISTAMGWINGSDIFIVSQSEANKRYKRKYSDKDYYMLLKHEMAHVFTRVSINYFNGQQLSPDWLWEGVATYVSGMNAYYKKPEKFTDFLSCVIKDMGKRKVYEESGHAVEFLVKNYGKEKLLKLIKFFKEEYSEEAFRKYFKKIYGFELNYKNFNK